MSVYRDPAPYLEAIRTAGARIADLARRDLTVPVPTCPGWSVADLVGHLGSGYRHKQHIIQERVVDVPPAGPHPPQNGLVDWFEDAARGLLEVLTEDDPDEPVWTWFPTDQTVGFWQRRMAHETTIHRIDMEGAARVERHTVDAGLAADGVDEVIGMLDAYANYAGAFLPARHGIDLRIAGTGQSWLLRSGTLEDGDETPHPAFRLEPDAPLELIATGSAAELYVFLWGRSDGRSLHVTGERDGLTQLRNAAALVTG